MRAARSILLAILVSLGLSASAHAAFPGQNGKIAFESNEGGVGIEVFVMNADGTNPVRLTDSSGWNRDPTWSPDGTRIAFWSSRDNAPGVYVINPDGSEETPLFVGSYPPGYGTEPAWSPDGTKIAFNFGGIWVMNADGSGATEIIENGREPAWSPDGTSIAFTRLGEPGIWTANPDGSGAQQITTDPPFSGAEDMAPAWSPDGTTIAFSRYIGTAGEYEVFLVDAGGGNEVNLTAANHPNSKDGYPAWSPDGSKIAYGRLWPFIEGQQLVRDIEIMNADGSGKVVITDHYNLDDRPDWQPVQPGYPRPKGATPLRASLVPAYVVCAAPNRTHGPPLAFPSCNPPQERSATLTVGTPDANGAAADMAGYVRMQVVAGDTATPGDQADVSIEASVTDVRCGATSAACPGGAGSDYAGKLLTTPGALRITDRLNTPPGPDGVPGTGEGQLQIPFDCTPTASPATGSTCGLSTTIDALLPGAVREGKRAIWELGQIHVRDAGPNGTGYESPACPPACGDGDETLFLRQGLFVP